MDDQAEQHRRRPALRRDAGVTFVEILITVVLLGTVVLGILAGMRSVIIASATGREAAKVETALLNASDRVSRAPLKCGVDAYLPYAEAAIAPWEGDGTVSVTVAHLVFDPAQGAFAASSWNPGAPCPAATVDNQIQRVTITVTGPDREVRRSIDVIKSKFGGKHV